LGICLLRLLGSIFVEPAFEQADGVEEVIVVPDQIVVAVVAKLGLYEFGGSGGRLAKLLRILEKLNCRAEFAAHIWQTRVPFGEAKLPSQICGAYLATTRPAWPNLRRMLG
jgi:hypothetical protein